MVTSISAARYVSQFSAGLLLLSQPHVETRGPPFCSLSYRHIMPSLNFTFQESSPLIVYSGDWIAIYDHNDPDKSQYNGIFRPTTSEASATINFLGTGVSIFRATRTNHGPYSAVLDDQPPFQGNGLANPNRFNISLFGQTDLEYGNHTVTITNHPSPPTDVFLDIDYITIERQFGNPDDQLFNSSVDDTSPLVSYTGSWGSFPISTAFNNSQQRTANAGDQVTFRFQGCCVEVYGQYANANYTAALDSITPTTYFGFDADLINSDQQPQTLLFLADNLDEEKSHTLTLTNLDSDQNRPFFFDYTVLRSVRGTPRLLNLNGSDNAVTTTGTTGTTTRPPATTGTAKSDSVTPVHTSNPGAIAGAVVSAIVIVALLLLGLYLFKRRRISIKDRESGLSDLEPYTIPVRNVAASAVTSSPGFNYSPIGESRGRHSHEEVTFPGESHNPPTSSGPISTLSGHASTMLSGPTSSGALTSYYNHSGGDVPSVRHPQNTRSASFVSRSEVLGNTNTKTSHSHTLSRGTIISPIQEVDAGTVISENSTLPPAYDPAWEDRRDT
ncbi:hypothetical protein M422DRAFT_62809 [Sphaerobolus stellatus SS14]|nr:hypothetical protein M422DRAFT_62809 [Sphaerobolus stellatus SS14]